MGDVVLCKDFLSKLLAQNFLKILKYPIIMKIFTTMGYIEFFYKKFPGKSNDFQGGLLRKMGGVPCVALKHHEGGLCCLKPTENLRFSGVIFIESTIQRIVKKSVGAWGRGPGGRGQGARGMGAGGMGAGGDFSRGGCQWGETAPAGGGALSITLALYNVDVIWGKGGILGGGVQRRRYMGKGGIFRGGGVAIGSVILQYCRCRYNSMPYVLIVM